MDNLQYKDRIKFANEEYQSFKPYYKWIIFNILTFKSPVGIFLLGFKPYYKWIIFNIYKDQYEEDNKPESCFKPYYKWIIFNIIDCRSFISFNCNMF